MILKLSNTLFVQEQELVNIWKMFSKNDECYICMILRWSRWTAIQLTTTTSSRFGAFILTTVNIWLYFPCSSPDMASAPAQQPTLTVEQTRGKKSYASSFGSFWGGPWLWINVGQTFVLFHCQDSLIHCSTFCWLCLAFVCAVMWVYDCVCVGGC